MSKQHPSNPHHSGWRNYIKTSIIWILMILLFSAVIYFFMIKNKNALLDLNSLVKITFMIIVTGLFLNFFFLQNYYVVLSKIFDTLEQNTNQSSDDYYLSKDKNTYLYQTFSQFNENYKTYKTKYEAQNRILFERFLARLLKGEFHNKQELRTLVQEYNFSLNNDYVLILFDFQFNHNASDETRMQVYQFIRQNFNSFMRRIYQNYNTEVDGRLAFLIWSDVESLDQISSKIEIERMVKLMRDNIRSQYDYDLWVCIGNVSQGIMNCNTNYNQTLESLKKAQLTGKEDQLVFCDQRESIGAFENNHQQWFNYERRFINAIHSGDYDTASLEFNKLLKNDYIVNAPSLTLARFRLFGLLNSMMNALGEVHLSTGVDFFEDLNAHQLLLDCKTLPDLEKASKNIFEKIRTYSDTNDPDSNHDNKMKRIIDYLKENYSDSNMTAAMVAEHFNLNSSYFSRTFKNTFGIRFSDYLTDLRIGKACSLLTQTDLTLNEIAEEVGYNNALTLSRAFKKTENMTPGTYRNIKRNEDSSL